MEIRNKKGMSAVQLCPNEYTDTITQFKGVKRYKDINRMNVIGHQTIFSHFSFTCHSHYMYRLPCAHMYYTLLLPRFLSCYTTN